MPVNHSRELVNREAHTNHVESAWSLVKRGLIGVYHHVSAKYLQDYPNEFAFRGLLRREHEAMANLVLACY